MYVNSSSIQGVYNLTYIQKEYMYISFFSCKLFIQV